MNRWIGIIGSLVLAAALAPMSMAQVTQDNLFGDEQGAGGVGGPGGLLGPGGPGAGGGTDGQTAAEAAQQAQQQLIQQVAPINQQAAALAEAGDLDGAIAKYDESIALGYTFESLYQKGRLLRELGYFQEAIGAFTAAQSYSAEAGDNVVPFIVEFGQAFVDAEQFNTAISAFESALRGPGMGTNAELWFNKGIAEAEFAKNQKFATPQSRQEDIQKALDSFDRAIRLDPEYAEAYFERGMTYSLMGDIETAIEDFENAVKFDPSNTQALARLGLSSLSRGLSESNRRDGQRAKIDRDLQQAVTQMTRFLELTPPRPPGEEDDGIEIGREDILLQRSAAYIAQGDEAQGDRSSYYRNAIVDADEVISLEPDAADGHFQKAIALRMLGDLDGAMTELGETLKKAPANVQALLRRGIIQVRQSDYPGAIADLKKASLYAGGFEPRVHFWLGLCYAKTDKPIEAVREYSAALRFQPTFRIAQYNRGLAYMKLGRFDRAREDFGEVYRQDRSNEQARSLRDQATQLLRR